MARRSRPRAYLLLLLAASVAAASDQPPTALHLVGDHWTAWNPPATHPEDAKIHIVVRGDTLWDLSRQYQGNPYLWPQIWEKNQYVLDAHWIYPGDPLVVGLEVARADDIGAITDLGAGPGSGEASAEAAAAAAAAAAAEATAEGYDSSARSAAPVPLGSEDDIYCSGYIGDLDEEFPWEIVASEGDQLAPRLSSLHSWGNVRGTWGYANTMVYELSSGGIIYLDGGRNAGLSPGMVLMAVEAKGKVRHPATGDVLGRHYSYEGRVRVLTVQEDRAIAEIQETCAGLHVGSKLRRFEPEPVPLARRPDGRAANDPTTADLSSAPAIVLTPDQVFTIGEDHVVYIDRGEGDDIYPGDLFTVYRPSAIGLPPVPVGELAVLSVRGRSSVAKILESRYPIFLGDRLERR